VGRREFGVFKPELNYKKDDIIISDLLDQTLINHVTKKSNFEASMIGAVKKNRCVIASEAVILFDGSRLSKRVSKSQVWSFTTNLARLFQ
jgi:hypothetical protein